MFYLCILKWEQTKLNIIVMNINFEVLSFKGQSETVEVVKRISDGEVFKVGDYVTAGLPIQGNIESFEFSIRSGELFVYTSWSGIGFNLDSLQHTPRIILSKLPSAHQIGDEVRLTYINSEQVDSCKVIRVHFTKSKVMYDLEIEGRIDNDPNNPDRTWITRLYNIDSVFVTKY